MNMDPMLDPPDPAVYECNDCGMLIDGEGWCDPCIRIIRAEARADQ